VVAGTDINAKPDSVYNHVSAGRLIGRWVVNVPLLEGFELDDRCSTGTGDAWGVSMVVLWTLLVASLIVNRLSIVGLDDDGICIRSGLCRPSIHEVVVKATKKTG
jgi:hypothetical protein